MRVVTLFYLTTYTNDIEKGYAMFTIFLQGLKILMVSTILVFIIQTLRLSYLAYRSDPRSTSFLNSVILILTMPWLKKTPGSYRMKFIYYVELVSGKLLSEYRKYISNAINMVKVKCTEDPTDPNIQATVVGSFARECVIYDNLLKADTYVEFERLVNVSTGVLIHLINKDLRQIIKTITEVDLIESHTVGYSIIVSIIKVSNLHGLDTNTIIISSLDYLQDLDLAREYRCG